MVPHFYKKPENPDHSKFFVALAKIFDHYIFCWYTIAKKLLTFLTVIFGLTPPQRQYLLLTIKIFAGPHCYKILEFLLNKISAGAPLLQKTENLDH